LEGATILASVVLAVTGGEALYADMGHFGLKPIRAGWLGLAFPALVLNYFGQGALIDRDLKAADNPFYSMVPAGGGELRARIAGEPGGGHCVASADLGAFSLTRPGDSTRILPAHARAAYGERTSRADLYPGDQTCCWQ
jgi:KUP system potassium uptake protein